MLPSSTRHHSLKTIVKVEELSCGFIFIRGFYLAARVFILVRKPFTSKPLLKMIVFNLLLSTPQAHFCLFPPFSYPPPPNGISNIPLSRRRGVRSCFSASFFFVRKPRIR
jgi:hypothetical protein